MDIKAALWEGGISFWLIGLPILLVGHIPILAVAKVIEWVGGENAAKSYFKFLIRITPWAPKMKETDVYRFTSTFKLPPTTIPENLRGVWWMSGNPQPDDLTCLHRSIWYPSQRRLRIYLTGMDSWTWHDSVVAWTRAWSTATFRANYNFYFDEDLKKAYIIPQMFGIAVPLTALTGAKFEMVQLDDNLWDRVTTTKDTVKHYYLKRLIHPDGSVDEKCKKELIEAALDEKNPKTSVRQVYGTKG